MVKKPYITLAAVLAICLPTGFAIAAQLPASAEQLQTGTIYGSQLMTPKERMAYRAKLQAAKTAKEREQIRLEHHEEMMERAKSKGLTLPSAPPMGGAGMGPGRMNGGMGRGMGPGAGTR